MARRWGSKFGRAAWTAAFETTLLWAAWVAGRPGIAYAQGMPVPQAAPGANYESWSPPWSTVEGCGPAPGSYQPVPQPMVPSPAQCGPTAGPYAAPEPCFAPPYAGGYATAPYGATCVAGPAGVSRTLPPGALACRPTFWGFSAGALVLFPDDANHQLFSYDSAIESNQLLDARDAAADLLPGVQATLTWFDVCAMRGWEGVYWGLYPSVSMASVDNMDVTGDLNAVLNFDQLDYNGGPASAYVNDAVVHRVRTTTEFQNVEFNRLWGVARDCGSCSPWQLRALAGFRYLRFTEGLQFGADTVDAMFTGAADELYYTVDAENNLYGLQLGGTAERNRGGPWTLLCGVKAGVYANDASALSHIGGAAGTATVNNGPNNGRAWTVEANKCDAAFLAEIRAGAARRITQHWRVTADYRVLAVSGVALPTNQIYRDLRGLQDVERLATNGNVLLHGLFIGAERAY